MTVIGVERGLLRAVGTRMSRVPIRMKLTLAFAGAMVVLFGLLSLLLYVHFEAGLNEAIQSSLDVRAADLSQVARESDPRLKGHPPLPGSSGEFAQILDAQGRPLVSTPGVRDRPLLSPTELAGALQRPVSFDREDRLHLLARRVTSSSPHVLVVGVSLADRDRALSGLRRLLFIGGPIALLITCAAGYAVAAKALAPVESIRRRAAHIYGFESHERLPVPPAHDEVQRLGETLNEMLTRVEEVVGRGRALVAGASHELRTPLTILRLELDDALAGERSREDLEAAIRSAGEEVSRLTALAEDLLLIARADQERLPIEKEPVELEGVMRVVTARYSQLDGIVGRKVTFDATEAPVVRADVARVDQALSNMVDNALRYGKGPVVVKAGVCNGDVELHVFDNGPGFPSEFLPRAFERFSRADPARSRGGTGLGLSIVRAIAEAHGGRVDAENRPGGGAHVWLTLRGATAQGESDIDAAATADQACTRRN
jgi:two-component system, OmpR family, sensor kinase